MSLTRKYKSGELLFSQDQPAEAAFLIKAGTVGLIRQMTTGPEEIDRVGPGRLLGAVVLSSTKEVFNSYSAIARDEVEAEILTKEDWDNYTVTLPEIIRAYLTDLAKSGGAIKETGPRTEFYPLRRICAVIKMMALNELACNGAGPDGEIVLEYDQVGRQVKEILGLPAPAVESGLKKLHSVNLINITIKTTASRHVTQDPATFRQRVTTSRSSKRVIQVTEPSQMTVRMKRLASEIPELAAGSSEYWDLFELAEAVKAKPEMIIRKIAVGEIPPEVFLFHRDTMLNWAKEVGREFFRRPVRRQLKAEDLSSIDAIMMIDEATLQEAITKVGVQNLAQIIKESSPAIGEKIYANLSPRMAAIVQGQVRAIDVVDRSSAIDQEFKLVEAIKEIKGLT